MRHKMKRSFNAVSTGEEPACLHSSPTRLVSGDGVHCDEDGRQLLGRIPVLVEAALQG